MHRLGGKPNFKKGRMSGISYQSTTEWADDKQEVRISYQSSSTVVGTRRENWNWGGIARIGD